MSLLRGRVVLVAGAPRGVAAAVVRLLAAEGATPVLAFWTGGREAEGLATEAASQGSGLTLVRANLAEAGSEAVIVRRVLERHDRLDAVVLDVTGVPEPLPGRPGLEQAAASGLVGPVLLARAALAVMAPAGGGSIVAVASEDAPEPVALAGDGLLAWCARVRSGLEPAGVHVDAVLAGADGAEAAAARVLTAVAGRLAP